MTHLDLDSIRCFIAAATHSTFRIAARTVALSPSAFSARVRQLEENLGVDLFERTTRTVALTPAGERLLPEAQRVLEQLDRCHRAVVRPIGPVPFTLTLGTRFELGLSWLMPALDDLNHRRSERTFDIAFGDGPDLLHRAAAGEIDGVISSVRLAGDKFRYALLHEEQYVFVTTPALLAGQSPNDVAWIQDQVLIDAHASLPLFRYLLDSLPPDQEWRFRCVERLGTIAAIRRRVLQGRGIAVLPQYFVAHDLATGAMVLLLPDSRPQSDHFRLVWRTHHPREDDLRQLADELRGFPLC